MFPLWGRALSWRMNGPTSITFCEFLYADLFTIITAVSLVSHGTLCHDDSLVVINKQRSSFAWPLTLSSSTTNFLAVMELNLSTRCTVTKLGLSVCNPRSSTVAIRHKCLTINVEYLFQQRCSASSQQSTSEKPIEQKLSFFFQLFVGTRNTPWNLRGFRKLLHMSHDDSFQEHLPQVSLFLYQLVCSLFLILDHRQSLLDHVERVSAMKTVLLFTVNSPQTSLKELWISVRSLLRKVLILLYNRWSSTVTVTRDPALFLPLVTECAIVETKHFLLP